MAVPLIGAGALFVARHMLTRYGPTIARLSYETAKRYGPTVARKGYNMTKQGLEKLGNVALHGLDLTHKLIDGTYKSLENYDRLVSKKTPPVNKGTKEVKPQNKGTKEVKPQNKGTKEVKPQNMGLEQLVGLTLHASIISLIEEFRRIMQEKKSELKLDEPSVQQKEKQGLLEQQGELSPTYNVFRNEPSNGSAVADNAVKFNPWFESENNNRFIPEPAPFNLEP